jgi:hypothetical protein
MSDENFMDKSLGIAEHLSGESREQLDENFGAQFALHGPKRRAEILHEIDRTTAKGGDIDIEQGLERELKRADLVHRLKTINATLRRAGR